MILFHLIQVIRFGVRFITDVDLDGVVDLLWHPRVVIYLFDINGLKFDYDAGRWLIGTPVLEI